MHIETPLVASGLIQQAQTAYLEYEHKKLDRVFVTLSSVLDEIIKSDGDNRFAIPHMNKKRLERLGQMPTRLEASQEATQVVDTFMGELEH
jgi:hypothetical protein